MHLNDNFWRFWFVEPEIWLLRCFFQPADFQRDTERKTIGERLRVMSRLLLPLFCSSYPLAMLLRILLYLGFPSTYSTYTIHSFLSLQPDVLLFIFDCFWATAVSCLLGGLFGSLFSIVYGVALALALAFANGIIVNNQDDTLVGVIYGLSFGCFLGLTFNSLGAVRRSGLIKTTLGTGIGLLIGIGAGLCTGIIGGYWPGLLVGLLGGRELQQSPSIAGSVAGIIIGGIAGMLLVRVIGSIVRSSADSYIEVVEASTRIGIAVAAAFGVAVGTPVGDVGMHQGSLLDALSVGWMVVPVVGTAFLCTYITGYY